MVLEAAYLGIRTAEKTLHLTELEPEEATVTPVRFTWKYYLDHPEFLTLVNSESLHRTAMTMDAGLPATMDCSIAKCFASDNAVQHTANAVQILGGSGYIRSFEVEWLFRDVKFTQIREGADQIQRTIIARDLLRI
jgi:alkylation response protein AidB-like acyl-CoA dehydrogenase